MWWHFFNDHNLFQIFANKNPPIIFVVFHYIGGGLMQEPFEILSLLGIPLEKIKNYDCINWDKKESEIVLELVDDRSACKYCNKTHLRIHGYYFVNINNSVIKGRFVNVRIRMRRYKCLSCGRTFKESFGFYKPYCKISRAVEILIKEDLKKKRTYSDIALDYGISVNRVIQLFDQIGRIPRLSLTSTICVDEFHFSNQTHPKLKYPFVISDPFKSNIIDVIESRTAPYLNEYFKGLSTLERQKVKFFISDMNETYRNVKRVFFPDSIHVIDHFHIVKQFTEAIQKTRKNIMKSKKGENTKEYKFLKKYWKYFLVNRSRLKTFRTVDKYGVVQDWEIKIDAVLRQYPLLNAVYWAKEDFEREMLHKHYWNETDQALSFFIRRFENSLIDELVQIAKTLTNWKTEIINCYAKNINSFCLSNAIAEANNDNIQTLIDLSYGLGNFQRLRNRVLYINRNN